MRLEKSLGDLAFVVLLPTAFLLGFVFTGRFDRQEMEREEPRSLPDPLLVSPEVRWKPDYGVLDSELISAEPAPTTDQSTGTADVFEKNSEVEPSHVVPDREGRSPIWSVAAAIRGGESISELLYHAETITAGARSPRPLPDMRANYLVSIRDWLERVLLIGEPPWREDHFQIFGTLAGYRFAVPGRDRYLPASPEQTVDWVQHFLDRNAQPESVLDAIDLLRDFEVRRRELSAKIVERIRKGEGYVPVDDVIAYAVVDRELLLVRESDAPGLGELLHSMTQAAMVQEGGAIIRGWR